MNKLKIAVFASGSGSNFQAIIDRMKEGTLSTDIRLLVSDRPQSMAVERAHRAGIPVFSFRPKDYPSREHYEREILQQLREHDVDLVVLAGYMRLLTKVLVVPFEGKMINIHPSLLPAFAGVDAIGQALRYGVKWTGVTVHFVDLGMDTGPIIAQRVVEIADDDDQESLTRKIQAVEHELYPQVIRWFSEGRIVQEGRRVRVV